MLVLEPQPLFRLALEQTIRGCEAFVLAASCSCASDAFERAGALRPDIALVPGVCPTSDEDDVLIGLLTAAPDLKLLVTMPSGTGGSAVCDVLEAGVSACVSRDEPPVEFARALRAVAVGETFLSPKIHGELAAHIRSAARARTDYLTPRELEVLSLAAQGRAAPAIARELFLSLATVKTHIAHIYEKLGVSDRTSAVLAAIRLGLLPDPRASAPFLQSLTGRGVGGGASRMRCGSGME